MTSDISLESLKCSLGPFLLVEFELKLLSYWYCMNAENLCLILYLVSKCTLLTFPEAAPFIYVQHIMCLMPQGDIYCRLLGSPLSGLFFPSEILVSKLLRLKLLFTFLPNPVKMQTMLCRLFFPVVFISLGINQQILWGQKARDIGLRSKNFPYHQDLCPLNCWGLVNVFKNFFYFS